MAGRAGQQANAPELPIRAEFEFHIAGGNPVMVSVSRQNILSRHRARHLTENPFHGVISARFDMGFYVELADGRCGQLRVPEMSSSTAAWDRSNNEQDGINESVSVYLIREIDDRYYFSEFSAKERQERDEKHQEWIKAQEEAEIGKSLTVRIERKLEWGCVCRQETEPFLAGIIATHETVTKNQLPAHCAAGHNDWEALTEGATFEVEVCHKKWSHWRYMLYFSLTDALDG